MGSNPAWCTIFFPLYLKGIALLSKTCPSPDSRLTGQRLHLSVRPWLKWQQACKSHLRAQAADNPC